MAEANEVYRIYVGEGHKDVVVDNISGDSNVIDFEVHEVENIDGVNIGDKDSVDLREVSHDKLYTADGTSTTQEAPE